MCSDTNGTKLILFVIWPSKMKLEYRISFRACFGGLDFKDKVEYLKVCLNADLKCHMYVERVIGCCDNSLCPHWQ